MNVYSSFIPVQSIDQQVESSGVAIKLEVLRAWPFNAARDDLVGRRLECVDGERRGHGTIEIYLKDLWSTIEIQQYDILILTYPRLTDNAFDALSHPHNLVLDSSCTRSQLYVYHWKDRLLSREVQPHSYAALQSQADAGGKAEEEQKQQADPTTHAAPTIIDMTDENDDQNQNGQPPAIQPALMVGKKRKKGAEIHGAYTYTPLSEIAHRPKDKVNIYGVVLFVAPPKKTQGTDWMLSVTVTDKSLPLADTGVPINIFRSSPALLPSSLQRGDIIRIHRVEFSHFRGGMVGCAMEKRTAVIALKGTVGESLVPFFKPSDTYTEADREIVEDLREWTAQNLQHRVAAPVHVFSSSAAPSQWFRTISQIHTREFIDLFGKLLHVDHNQQLVYLWDGTDVQAPMQRPCFPNHAPLPDTGRITPRFGSILPITVSSQLLPHFPTPSPSAPPPFIHLRNVAVVIDQTGKLYVQYTRASKFALLEQTHERIQALLQAYDVRLAAAAEAQKFQVWHHVGAQPLSVTLHPTQPFTPLQQVSMPSQPLLKKYRCRVRVLKVYPEVIEECCKVYCEHCCSISDCAPLGQRDRCAQPTCQREDGVSYQYQLKLLLIDASLTPLTVYLWGEEANRFFNDAHPTNLKHSSVCAGMLQAKVEALLQPGAWLDVCIASSTYVRLPPTPSQYAYMSTQSQMMDSGAVDAFLHPDRHADPQSRAETVRVFRIIDSMLQIPAQ